MKPSLPPTPAAPIGREDDLRRLASAFESGARLVSLVGPGGVGKTTLARAFLREGAVPLLSPDLIVEVDLTEARTEEEIVELVAAVLVAPTVPHESSAAATEALGRYLVGVGGALLVLDNVEHIVELLGRVLGTWLRAAPELVVLATSREPLAIAAETTIDVGPLAREDAVHLFSSRAHLTAPSTEHERLLLGKIVDKLDRLPLAIEITAALREILSLEDILGRVERGIVDVASQRRDAVTHHRSMRATVEWSFGLLTETERRALAWLSVFNGGIAPGIAAAFLGRVEGAGEAAAIERLRGLRRRSLLATRTVGEGRSTRLVMYEAVREVASSLLDQGGEREEAERLHAALIVERMEVAVEDLRTRRALAAIGELSVEVANLDAIHQRFDEREPALALRAALCLNAFHYLRGSGGVSLRVLLPHIDRLARVEDPVLRASAAMAWLRAYTDAGLSDVEAMRAMLERECGQGAPPRQRAEALMHMGRRVSSALEYERARAYFAEAEAIAIAAGDQRSEMDAWARDALLLGFENNLTSAIERAQRALGRSEELEDPYSRLLALVALGSAWMHTNADAALTHFEEAIKMQATAGFTFQVPLCLSSIANAALACGDYGRAEASARAAQGLYRTAQTTGAAGYASMTLSVSLACQRRFREARESIAEAIAWSSSEGTVALSYFIALQAAIEALSGRLEAAEALFAQARDKSMGNAGIHGATLTLSLLVEVAKAKELADGELRARALKDLEAHISALQTSAALSTSGTPRYMWHHADRLFTTAFEKVDAARRSEARPLVVEGTGAYFVLPDGVRVDLASRKPLRRILAALAESRSVNAPAYSVMDLFAVGWPGDRTTGEPAAARVYVAVRALRNFGLTKILRRDEDGYSLDAAVPIMIADEGT